MQLGLYLGGERIMNNTAIWNETDWATKIVPSRMYKYGNPERTAEEQAEIESDLRTKNLKNQNMITPDLGLILVSVKPN
jgi:hypothetical protein